MKRILIAALAACVVMFSSCEAEGILESEDQAEEQTEEQVKEQTEVQAGDQVEEQSEEQTVSIFGIWALDSKTEVIKDSKGNDKSNKVDYSKFHFYLAFGQPYLALAKKGSLSNFDLDDVDVDGTHFSYDTSKKKIRFNDILWLSEGLLYHMRLSGTYDVIELSENRLVIQQEVLGVKTIFSYHRR
ncbi:MAG: hypothetical protein J6Y06_06570 [Bacteroidales bacterium]|nr:hypothetical protein [Bacteroidales bacterium]